MFLELKTFFVKRGCRWLMDVENDKISVALHLTILGVIVFQTMPELVHGVFQNRDFWIFLKIFLSPSHGHFLT